MAKLLHLTDLHLFRDSHGTLKSVTTWNAFMATYKVMLQTHPDADCLILGGDLAHDASLEAYGALKGAIESFPGVVLFTLGNHDAYGAAFNVLGPSHRFCDLPGWRIVVLQTLLPGYEKGTLTATELRALEETLSEATGRHVMIFMHHPPCSIGSLWIDRIALGNAHAFWSIVLAHQQVRAIVFGHVHQDFEGLYEGIRLMGTPSTCVQFKPRSPVFHLDDAHPGYRWIELKEDGSFLSEVHRIPIQKAHA